LKHAAVAASLLLFPAVLWAQSDEEKLEKKLAGEWLKKANWITDFDQAREEAKKSKKTIFAYFTRSYAP